MDEPSAPVFYRRWNGFNQALRHRLAIIRQWQTAVGTFSLNAFATISRAWFARASALALGFVDLYKNALAQSQIIGKLRGAALFLIFYFVINNLRHLRAVKFLVFALIFSCMVSAVWSPIERIIGRGVKISGVSEESLLAKAIYYDHDTYLEAIRKKRKIPDDLRIDFEKIEARRLIEGDTIIEVNGKKIRTPNELAAEIEKKRSNLS